MQVLVGLRHLELGAGEIEVRRHKGQKLAQVRTAPVEDFEGVVTLRFVELHVGETQVLLARPEDYLATLGRAHARSLYAGVTLKAVVAHSVVEDGRKLVVHRV